MRREFTADLRKVARMLVRPRRQRAAR
jgi:hypothetical protein